MLFTALSSIGRFAVKKQESFSLSETSCAGAPGSFIMFRNRDVNWDTSPSRRSDVVSVLLRKWTSPDISSDVNHREVGINIDGLKLSVCTKGSSL